jgi:ubiquinone biosynthesis protein UbiJ
MPLPMSLEAPIRAAINHLLRAESWARERLTPFAGETIEVRNAPFPPLRFSIEADGLLAQAAPEAAAALLVALKPEAAAALLRGEEHFLRAVEVSGNARLAEAVMTLVRHLRFCAGTTRKTCRGWSETSPRIASPPRHAASPRGRQMRCNALVKPSRTT